MTQLGNPITAYTQPEANKAVRLFLEQQAAYAAAGIGIRTGFPSIDAAIPAFLPGDLVTLHGMTGECKTTVLQQIVRHIAGGLQKRPERKDGRRPVLVYAHTEELVEILNVRMWNDRKVSPKSVIEGKAQISDVERRSIATSGLPIVFVGGAEMQDKIHPDALEDFGAMTVDGIAATCHQLITRDHLAPEVVVIDHMHDLSIRGGGATDDQVRAAAVFQRIAWFKNWLKATVILICQDNDRTIMQRAPDDRQPRKTDISYSQGVLRTSAAIFSVWKPGGHLDLGPSDVGSVERLTAHGRQVLNVTQDSILLKADKTRYSNIAGTSFLLSGRGNSGVWGDVQEVDTSKWPSKDDTMKKPAAKPEKEKPPIYRTEDVLTTQPVFEEIVLDRNEWHTTPS